MSQPARPTVTAPITVTVTVMTMVSGWHAQGSVTEAA